MSADYLGRLATEASEARDAHGSDPVWWTNHDPTACEKCRALGAKLAARLVPLGRCWCPDCGASHKRIRGSIQSGRRGAV